MNAVIIIPVYKFYPNDLEEKSITSITSVLTKRRILFVAPFGLDISAYKKFQLPFEFFHPSFFSSISGYNRLLMSIEFFKRFSDYSHMLICQTDTWVFRDELDNWMQLPYDYIGSPIQGKDGAWMPYGGNGGFSLRNIEASLRVLKKWRIMDSPKNVWKEHQKFHNWSGLLLRSPIILARMAGYRNNSLNFVKEFGNNEDVFWSVWAAQIYKGFRVAPFSEEIAFGFDRFPQELFEKNHQQLPFGCHAWEKNYDNFWKNFIH